MTHYQFLPSLSLEEYEALRESIQKYGVLQPVIVDENGVIIDGYHRAKACKEIGIDYPTQVVGNIPEEEKENLSVSMNFKRRNLSKEQKREVALVLREQGWTQERIASVMEVGQKTISNWLSNFTKPLDHTPSLNKDELVSLKLQLEEGRKEVENLKNENELLRKEQLPEIDTQVKRLEENTAKLKIVKRTFGVDQAEIDRLRKEKQAEIDAQVKSRVEAMRIDFEKRLKENTAKLKAANKPAEIDQAAIDRLVEERASAKIAELEKARREADAERVNYEREHEKKLAALKESDEWREKEFNRRLDEKMQELDAAAKLGTDLQALKKELDALHTENEAVRLQIEEERESLNIRTKIKKIFTAVNPVLTLTHLVDETIAKSPNYCGLTIEDMERYVEEIDTILVFSKATIASFKRFISEIRQGGGLRVVENN